LQEGLELMYYGMGTVVLFLTVLVMAVTLMCRLVARYAKPAAGTAPARIAAAAAGRKPAAENDERLVAVISAAIHRYRSRHRS
jgi:oxaloacetate decarboxylase (Na+ extruding) subunit gamma